VSKHTWVIDVCRTCGRLAAWPFCEHRDQWLKTAHEQTQAWCVAIVVTGHWDPPKEDT
jgi:hypothetical protein